MPQGIAGMALGTIGMPRGTIGMALDTTGMPWGTVAMALGTLKWLWAPSGWLIALHRIILHCIGTEPAGKTHHWAPLDIALHCVALLNGSAGHHCNASGKKAVHFRVHWAPLQWLWHHWDMHWAPLQWHWHSHPSFLAPTGHHCNGTGTIAMALAKIPFIFGPTGRHCNGTGKETDGIWHQKLIPP